MDYTYFDVMKNRKSSSNEMNGAFPAHTPIGMAYVPYQTWEEPYATEDALLAGTLFPELDYPLEHGGRKK